MIELCRERQNENEEAQGLWEDSNLPPISPLKTHYLGGDFQTSSKAFSELANVCGG